MKRKVTNDQAIMMWRANKVRGKDQYTIAENMGLSQRTVSKWICCVQNTPELLKVAKNPKGKIQTTAGIIKRVANEVSKQVVADKQLNGCGGGDSTIVEENKYLRWLNTGLLNGYVERLRKEL